MILSQNKNLLPKKLADRAALKTQGSEQSFKVRGSKKLTKVFRRSRLAKLFLGLSLLLYFSGYQPVLAIPPLRQNIAQAEFSQEQKIESANFPEAFNLPHPGYLTTHFSWWHPGVDIATGLGMPIHPIASGKVAEVTYGFFGLGHFVVIEHEQGFKSTYGHMGRIFVKVGDDVTKTSILGEVGVTGHTSGPHTHLELTKNGQSVDPLTVLPALSNWPALAGEAPRGASASDMEETKTNKQEEKAKPNLPKLSLLDLSVAGREDQDPKVIQLLHPLQPLLGQNAPQIAPSPY